MPWETAAQREELFIIFFSCVQIIEQKWNPFLLKSRFSASLLFSLTVFWDDFQVTYCELGQGDFVSVCWRSELRVQLFSDRRISAYKMSFIRYFSPASAVRRAWSSWNQCWTSCQTWHTYIGPPVKSILDPIKLLVYVLLKIWATAAQ